MNRKTTAKRICSLLIALLLLLAPCGIPAQLVYAASNEQIIFDFLREEMGLNSAAACGVLANIYYESDFDPHNIGDYGTSYGICQWHDSRWTDLKNYCAANGYDWTTITGQLYFLDYELATSYPSTYSYLHSVPNTADGAYDAAYYWCYYFEIPANRASMAVMRGNLAKNSYWRDYGGVDDTLPLDKRYATPFRVQTLSESGALCFSDIEMSQKFGTIPASSDCTVLSIYTNGTARVSCPWTDGSERTVFVSLKAFIDSTVAPASAVAPRKAITYTRTTSTAALGWIDAGDALQIVDVKGGMTQVIYPGTTLNRCAWVHSSELSSSVVPTVTVSSVKACPGDMLMLTAAIDANPGFSSFDLNVNYDTSRLSLVNVAPASALGGSLTRSGNTVKWTNTANVTANDILLILTFSVLSTAADGSAKVSLAAGTGGVKNAAGQNVSLSFANGSIDVDRHLVHSFNAGVITKQPTCIAQGVKTYTCTICGETYTEKVAVVSHNFGSYVYGTPDYSQHTVPRSVICKSCSYTKTEDVRFVVGDVDWNGTVTATDARFALRRTVNLENYEKNSPQFLACDVDRDGTVTAADTRMILRAAVGLENSALW